MRIISGTSAYDSRQHIKTVGILLGRVRSIHLYIGLIATAYVYVVGLVFAGILSPWALSVLLSLPKAISLSAGIVRKVPDTADANTAQFNTVFGLLLIAALIMDKVVCPVIAGAVLLACLGWGITFGLAGHFWLKIGLSVIVVVAYSFIWQRPNLSFRSTSVILGVASAALLYLVFLLGNAIAPIIVHEAPSQVGGIYGLGTGTNRILVALLLLFITGPGEEIFWRGFLQSRMQDRWGTYRATLPRPPSTPVSTSFPATSILVLAALVAGAFWGALYLWRRDMALLIVSHSLWSAVIFAVAPVR